MDYSKNYISVVQKTDAQNGLKGGGKMKQAKIIIKAIYSWYNVYVDNILILKNLKQADVDDLIQKLHDTNTAYDLKL